MPNSVLGALDVVVFKTRQYNGDNIQSKQVYKVIRDCDSHLEGKTGIEQNSWSVGVH